MIGAARQCAARTVWLFEVLWLTACISDAYLGAAPPDGGSTRPQPSAAGDAGHGSRSADADAATRGDGDTDPSLDAALPREIANAGAPGSPLANPNDSGTGARLGGLPTEGVCIANPSFESAPVSLLYGLAYVQAPWTGCFSLQDAILSAPQWVNETTLVDTGSGVPIANVLRPAADGTTYLYLDTAMGGKGQSTGQLLCGSLLAGHSYGFSLQLMSRVGEVDKNVTLQPGTLEVYASPDNCSTNEGPLWVSPPLTAAWTRHCVTIQPVRDSMNLVFRLPLDPAGRSAIGVDDIRVLPGCGGPLP
jgi:hypothetical protein